MNKARDGIIGVVIGDMLGVPVEFIMKEELNKNPVTDLGTHKKYPKGTWSDDSSLTLCLADSLTHGYSLEDMAQTFLRWRLNGEWTSTGHAWDIGRQTNSALNDLYRILESGDVESLKYMRNEAREDTNGNGSLMRILPLYFYLRHDRLEDHFDTVWEVSALTHPHVRAALACLMYLIMINEIEQGGMALDAYQRTSARMGTFMEKFPEERKHFTRLIDHDIRALTGADLESGGYVMETLESSFWCLLTTTSYKEAVLAAVNLGYDTDTTAAVTGGLAGIHYGIDSAPKEWYASVQRIGDIETVCDKLAAKYP